MRKRTLQVFVKGESKAYALISKYTRLGYFCSLSVYRNEHNADPEETIFRFHIDLGEKCPWFA